MCRQKGDFSWLSGKFGNKPFIVTAVIARQKNAGIAGPVSNFSNAAMATVTKTRCYRTFQTVVV